MKNTQQPQATTTDAVTLKSLFGHYFMFRFVGSVALFFAFGAFTDWFEKTNGELDFFWTVNTILSINMIIQLFFLIGATRNYLKGRQVL